MPNRLAHETSPYLLQHADNPVDWYPWGEEAFARARAEDKPVLVSIGYAACHWCHVMERESFEDPDVALVMNHHFVCVKVDREERPDVDAIYMDAVQAMTGSGGWPLNAFLTPDGVPFFAGTYFPPEPRQGRPSWKELLAGVHNAWTSRREEIEEAARTNIPRLQGARFLEAPPETEIVPELLDTAVASLRRAFDAENGGWGGAPKFPAAPVIEFLLARDERAMPLQTLRRMASGGIYDQVGGGFARYAVDPSWVVPHFEKMLYDQALLARLYLHAWQVLGEDRYRQVVDETLGYVLRDLRQPEGGFSSAEDADSEGEEGRFYVWRPEQLDAALGPDLAATAAAWYGVTRSGNFEGSNILHRPVRGDLRRPPEVEEARRRLFEARTQRVRPGLDDKVLTEWNGLMIATLAEAASATDTQAWLDAAVAAADFLLAHLRRPDGRWLRSWQRDGGARHLAYASDHAALVEAFTRLAEATGRARWIDEARATADAMLELFWDDREGGLYTVGRDAEQLVARQKDLLDNATPSANATAALALLRLGALTGEARYEEHADAILRLLGHLATTHPTAFGHLLAAADQRRRGAVEVAVVGERADLVEAVQRAYRPRVVLAWGEPYPSPLWEDRRPGFAYVCRRYACQAPVDDPVALVAQLDRA